MSEESSSDSGQPPDDHQASGDTLQTPAPLAPQANKLDGFSSTQFSVPPPVGLGTLNLNPTPGNVPVFAPVPVKLQKQTLPTFDGNLLEWTSIWEIFNYSVHQQNPSVLPPLAKFGYLKGLLTGQVVLAIDGLSATAVNNPVAIDILQRRFGDTDIIRDTLYAEFGSISIQSNKVQDLRAGIDAIERTLRQLTAIGELIEHPSIVCQILQKLHYATLLELERSKPNPSWTVADLRMAL